MLRHKKLKAFIATLKAKGLSPFQINKIVEGMKPPVTDRGAGWDFLKWFVRLANTDVRQLRAGDLLNLQEDLMKFLPLGVQVQGSTFPPPSVDELESLQKTLSKHLHELFDGGRTFIGPFESTVVAIRQPIKPTQDKKEETLFVTMTVPIEQDKWFVKEFAILLEPYGSLISKCPHCGQIFLKLRSNAVYCGRRCQSVSAMRKIRSEKMKPMEDNSKKRKKGRRSKYGKTKR